MHHRALAIYFERQKKNVFISFVMVKPVDCVILGAIGALKKALASNLPYD